MVKRTWPQKHTRRALPHVKDSGHYPLHTSIRNDFKPSRTSMVFKTAAIEKRNILAESLTTFGRLQRGLAHLRKYIFHERSEHFGPKCQLPDLFHRRDKTYLELAEQSLQWRVPPPYRHHDVFDVAYKIVKCEAAIGYTFTNKMHVIEALKTTGQSYPVYFNGSVHPVKSNTRLALLGDRVLSMALCEIWFQTTYTRHQYQAMSMDLVSRLSLGRRGALLGVQHWTLKKQRIATKDTIAETFEAILGAVYMDAKERDEGSGSGLEAVTSVLRNIGLDQHQYLHKKKEVVSKKSWVPKPGASYSRQTEFEATIESSQEHGRVDTEAEAGSPSDAKSPEEAAPANSSTLVGSRPPASTASNDSLTTQTMDVKAEGKGKPSVQSAPNLVDSSKSTVSSVLSKRRTSGCRNTKGPPSIRADETDIADKPKTLAQRESESKVEPSEGGIVPSQINSLPGGVLPSRVGTEIQSTPAPSNTSSKGETRRFNAQSEDTIASLSERIRQARFQLQAEATTGADNVKDDVEQTAYEPNIVVNAIEQVDQESGIMHAETALQESKSKETYKNTISITSSPAVAEWKDGRLTIRSMQASPKTETTDEAAENVSLIDSIEQIEDIPCWSAPAGTSSTPDLSAVAETQPEAPKIWYSLSKPRQSHATSIRTFAPITDEQIQHLRVDETDETTSVADLLDPGFGFLRDEEPQAADEPWPSYPHPAFPPASSEITPNSEPTSEPASELKLSDSSTDGKDTQPQTDPFQYAVQQLCSRSDSQKPNARTRRAWKRARLKK